MAAVIEHRGSEMKRFFIFVILPLLFCITPGRAYAQDRWEYNVFWGIDYLYRQLSSPINKIFVLKVTIQPLMLDRLAHACAQEDIARPESSDWQWSSGKGIQEDT